MTTRIGATATIDDKLSPGLAKIENNLEKFSFSANGVFTKLARSFSLTDVAVGALVGGVAKLVTAMDKSAKAFEESASRTDPLIKKTEELNKRIRQNDEDIGKHAYTWKVFFREVEAEASDKMAKVIGWMEKARVLMNVLGNLPGHIPGVNLNGGGLTPGPAGGTWSGSNPPPTSRPGPSFIGPQLPVPFTGPWDAWQQSIRGPAGAQAARTPNWWGGFPGESLVLGGRRPGLRGGMQPIGKENFGSDPNGFMEMITKQEDAQRKLAEQAEAATQRIQGSFAAMFDAILSGSGNVADQIKDIFLSLLRDIAAQAAGRAVAKGLVGLIPGIGPLLAASSSGSAMVAPAASASTLRSMDYMRSRGVM